MWGLVFEIYTGSYLYRDTSHCLCLDAEEDFEQSCRELGLEGWTL